MLIRISIIGHVDKLVVNIHYAGDTITLPDFDNMPMSNAHAISSFFLNNTEIVDPSDLVYLYYAPHPRYAHLLAEDNHWIYDLMSTLTRAGWNIIIQPVWNLV